MKKLISIFLISFLSMLGVDSFASSIEYTLRVPDSGLPGSSWTFDVSEFAADTIAYGDTVTFHVYVDCNKDQPVAPMLYLLFDEAGTTDSLKVISNTYYSQFAALNYEQLDTLQAYYIKTFDADTTVYDFSSADYYPIVVADSIATTGLAWPSFSYMRSAYYKVLVIPLKTDVAVMVKDIRFRLFINPAQFK